MNTRVQAIFEWNSVFCCDRWPSPVAVSKIQVVSSLNKRGAGEVKITLAGVKDMTLDERSTFIQKFILPLVGYVGPLNGVESVIYEDEHIIVSSNFTPINGVPFHRLVIGLVCEILYHWGVRDFQLMPSFSFQRINWVLVGGVSWMKEEDKFKRFTRSLIESDRPHRFAYESV